MAQMFDHERLEVYQAALRFAVWLEPILGEMQNSSPIKNQIERASISILLNIAEGNAKFTGPDRCRFFDTARGSAMECAAGLDILAIKSKLGMRAVETGKESLRKIVGMLVGLVRANSDYRFREAAVEESLD